MLNSNTFIYGVKKFILLSLLYFGTKILLNHNSEKLSQHTKKLSNTSHKIIKDILHIILDEAREKSAINLSKASQVEIKHDTKKDGDTKFGLYNER